MDRLAGDPAVPGNRRVASETVLEGQLEVAPGRLACLAPEFVEEGGVGQPAEGVLGPPVDQFAGRVSGRRLVEGVLLSSDGQLLVTEDVEEAPADLAVCIVHQLLFRCGRGDRFGEGGVDLGKDQAALLEEVGVVVALDGDGESLEDPVDEADSLITV